MAAGQTVSIIVDDREAASAVLAALRCRPEVATRVARLPLGDYLVDDALLFERKTLPDLVASIKDGRLFAQGLPGIGPAAIPNLGDIACPLVDAARAGAVPNP